MNALSATGKSPSQPPLGGSRETTHGQAKGERHKWVEREERCSVVVSGHMRPLHTAAFDNMWYLLTLYVVARAIGTPDKQDSTSSYENQHNIELSS